MERRKRIGIALISLAMAWMSSAASALAGDPGTWTATGSMITGRDQHTATVLANGTVLVAGGENDDVGGALASAEVYSPDTGLWSATGQLHLARWGHSATRLTNGEVLIVGGWTGAPGGIVREAEIYNPRLGRWRVIKPPLMPHIRHTAALLPNGDVLVAGGCIDANCFATYNYAEIYSPKTRTWTAAAPMLQPHVDHTETVLASGQVIVAGGSPYPGNFAEAYDPVHNTWTATGPMQVGRTFHTATLLPDGRILVAGGNDVTDFNLTTATAEIFDPATLTWAATGSLSVPRSLGSAAFLTGTGQVLVAGGLNIGAYVTMSELYDPGTGKFVTTGALMQERNDQTMNLLPNGRVLIAGGIDSFSAAVYLAEAELYSP